MFLLEQGNLNSVYHDYCSPLLPGLAEREGQRWREREIDRERQSGRDRKRERGEKMYSLLRKPCSRLMLKKKNAPWWRTL